MLTHLARQCMHTRRARWPLSGVLMLLIIAVAGCDIHWAEIFGQRDDDGDNTTRVEDADVRGLDVAVSDFRFDPTYNNLEQAIDRGADYQILKVDLADNANRDIRPTRVIVYADPNRMTPIIAADRRAGLDLPPAVLVYRDEDDTVGVAYNSSDYLAARYDVANARDALDNLADDQARLAADAAGNDVSRRGRTGDIGRGEGIVDRTSRNSFDATLDKLVNAIQADGDLDLLARFDHRAAAHSIGSMLDANDDPATLVIVNAGADQARLIAGGQTVAVDLPVRILVSQNTDGITHVDYSRPGFLADRHDLDAPDAVNDLDRAIRDLVDTAIE